MTARIVSGVGFGTVLAWLLLTPAIPAAARLGLVFLAGAGLIVESRNLAGLGLLGAAFYFALGGMAILSVSVYYTLTGGLSAGFGTALALAGLMLLAVSGVLETALRDELDPDLGVRGLSVGYLHLASGVVVAAATALLASPQGSPALIAALALVWGSDAGAYFTGKLIGKTPLTHKLSPNKTWEGLTGQAAGGAVLGALTAGFFFQLSPTVLAAGAGLGALLGLLALAGDLSESYCKRLNRTKDSSELLFAQGGLLDKMDGLILTLPLIAATVWGLAG